MSLRSPRRSARLAAVNTGKSNASSQPRCSQRGNQGLSSGSLHGPLPFFLKRAGGRFCRDCPSAQIAASAITSSSPSMYFATNGSDGSGAAANNPEKHSLMISGSSSPVSTFSRSSRGRLRLHWRQAREPLPTLPAARDRPVGLQPAAWHGDSGCAANLARSCPRNVAAASTGGPNEASFCTCRIPADKPQARCNPVHIAR